MNFIGNVIFVCCKIPCATDNPQMANSSIKATQILKLRLQKTGRIRGSASKQRRNPVQMASPVWPMPQFLTPNTGRVEEELLAAYNCCAIRFELRNTGLSTNEF
jgi:hypothetical protein